MFDLAMFGLVAGGVVVGVVGILVMKAVLKREPARKDWKNKHWFAFTLGFLTMAVGFIFSVFTAGAWYAYHSVLAVI